jgi:hypothetical protein
MVASQVSNFFCFFRSPFGEVCVCVFVCVFVSFVCLCSQISPKENIIYVVEVFCHCRV